MAKDILEEIDRALELLDMAHAHARNGDWMATVRCFGALPEPAGEAAMVAVQRAYDEGATQKAIAAALNAPVSTLRGLKKTNAKPKSDGLDGLRSLLP